MMGERPHWRPEDEARAATSSRRLAERGYPGVASLPAALEAGDVAVRAEAAFLLGHAGDRAAVEALRRGLQDESARVRVEAALALARLGWEDEALPVLRGEVGGVFFQDAPLRAARALAVLDDPSGYPRVLEALADALPSNRMEAIAVLPAFLPFAGQESAGGRIDPIAALARAAGDPEPLLRRDALEALGRLDDPRATATLEATVRDDEDASVRETAQHLLASRREEG